MSKANSAIKVLQTGIKRVAKGWTQGDWKCQGPDGKWYVCMEGALFGYCSADVHGLTAAQDEARDVCLQIIAERYPEHNSIPGFNDDPERTKDEVLEVMKLALIRLETGGGDDENYLDDEDVDSLLEFSANEKK